MDHQGCWLFSPGWTAQGHTCGTRPLHQEGVPTTLGPQEFGDILISGASAPILLTIGGKTALDRDDWPVPGLPGFLIHGAISISDTGTGRCVEGKLTLPETHSRQDLGSRPKPGLASQACHPC